MELKELANKYPGYFIVNYDDYEVIYTEGYENENKLWCYKISDLEKMPEKNNIIPQKQENDGSEQSSDETSEQTEENSAENSETQAE